MRFTVMPAELDSPVLNDELTGVRDPETGLDLPPRRTRVSIDLSRFPFRP